MEAVEYKLYKCKQAHDEKTHNSNYRVQSLYYSCLNYLRKNHRLINFTILSEEIGNDMAIIMRDSTHLKKFRMMPYRRIKTFNFESYVYKHYPEEARVYTGTDYLNNCVINGEFHEYIPGVLTVGRCTTIIYEPKDQKLYSLDVDDYDYINRVYASSLRRLYPKIKFHENSKGITKVYSEEFFDQHPGMAEWAESVEYISQKLWIPENLIE